MRKVAICGFASRTRRTDWPADVEVWTVNCAWDYGFTRITRLFEMHPLAQLTADLDKPTKWEGKHWIYLQQPHEFPIYMMAHDDRIPASVEYPLGDVCVDLFGKLRRRGVPNVYLTSSASFMLALAIHEGVDEVYIAGLEMASGSEYTYQRDGFAYMVGLANGRGIHVELPENTGLFKAAIYSYEGGQFIYRETIEKHLAEYWRQYDEGLIAPNQNTYRADGAVRALTELLAHTDLPFIGRQGLERSLQKYGSQHSQAMGYYNKFVTTQEDGQKWGPILMQCEGAIQAYENMIEVCDLQEPNLAIHEITHFVELNKVRPEMVEV